MLFNIRHAHRKDRSSYRERIEVEKTYDTEISEIGRYQAFKIGVKLGQVAKRDKKFCFIVSPHIRCLETAELLVAGLNLKPKHLYQGKIFIEDAIRES